MVLAVHLKEQRYINQLTWLRFLRPRSKLSNASNSPRLLALIDRK